MRLAWGIMIAFCLGFPAWGVVSQQQESSAPANATQTPAESAPQSESPVEQKKETQAAPTETKTEPKTDPQQTEPEIQPRIESQPTEIKTEPTKKAAAPPTEATVKRPAPGPVDAPRQETVSQIHNYMQGARAALKEGDISRGHTLALKANLLADDRSEEHTSEL